ncbi:MAG: metalloregulator ArsR/SmtB family transcription factor [Hallerella sp.]|jgi:DNA-binding transcriptional ArsR family regulator|nr:metalloregulator ArsR/SmtB family transcription factor [Fibrobacter sp.]MDY6370249.1 metalloregulator ArsR/SmtB family transcription factor [Fibrobacter sp.]MDY6389365.1 metalloregulator ArsR/SmtB family transcription factor [Fibrobacter sp.]MEE3340118.1 metalloregulator ArsR/SmtB family transcription factor [Hallerella sp.]
MKEKKLTHEHPVTEEELILAKRMPTEKAAVQVAEAMKQLGDVSRLRIFWLLCHAEECVTNIAELVNMSSPAVSHHLRLLKNAGLISYKRVGKEMFYTASDTALVHQLHHTIESVAEITCPEED